MTPPLPDRPGKGGRRKAQTSCIHGHELVADPYHSSAGVLRFCVTCARRRAQEQSDAVGHAAALLSLPVRAYVAVHGRSTRHALDVVSAVEASRPVPPPRRASVLTRAGRGQDPSV